MGKILLVISVLLTDGSYYSGIQRVETYDECYSKAISLVYEYEKNPENIREVQMECINTE